MDLVEMALADIKWSPKLQVREIIGPAGALQLRPDKVDEYKEALEENGRRVEHSDGRITIEDFRLNLDGEIIVFTDGETFLGTDGFHREAAYQQLGVTHCLVEVRHGGFDDAVLVACEVNARPGMTYTKADKNKVCGLYIQALHNKGVSLGQEAIARKLHIGRTTVRRIWREMQEQFSLPLSRQVVTSDNRAYTMTPSNGRNHVTASMGNGFEDDVPDGADEEVYATIARKGQTSGYSNGHGSNGTSKPRTQPTAIVAPIPPAQKTVNIMITYSYLEDDGTPMQGSVTLAELDKLPDIVYDRLSFAITPLEAFAP